MENSKINHSTKSEIIVTGECQELLKVIRILNKKNIKYSITEGIKKLECKKSDEDIEYERFIQNIGMWFELGLLFAIMITIIFWGRS